MRSPQELEFRLADYVEISLALVLKFSYFLEEDFGREEVLFDKYRG
jgi:hypothetical protein